MLAPVTIALLIINVVVFIVGYLTENAIIEFALVPVYLTEDPAMFAVSSFISMFLHAGVAHIAFNMLALFTIGRILEPHLGSVKFIAVYILSGFAGAGLHTASAFISQSGIYTPVVGASGAISGIIGISAALGDRVAIFWLIAQIPFAFSGFSSVAWFAHIGGFIFGFASGRVMLYMRKRKEHYDGYYV
jgi:membrane associated rhomboid family serine protease